MMKALGTGGRAATAVALLVLVGLSVGGPAPVAMAHHAGSSATVVLGDATGTRVGTVSFAGDGVKVTVNATVRGLQPGFHGFHVHAVGLCEAPFTSASGHFNPQGTTHGDHAGDLPALLVNLDGSGSLRFTTDRFSIHDLLDEDGSAVIVHAARDNYANIPVRYHSHDEDVFGPDSITLATGDAGARVACGVVQ